MLPLASTHPIKMRHQAFHVLSVGFPLKLTSFGPPQFFQLSLPSSVPLSHARISFQAFSFTALWMGTTTPMSEAWCVERPFRCSAAWN